MKKKRTEIKTALSGISMTIFFVCAVLIIIGLVPMTYHGFAVDSNGKLYVGYGQKINVYEGGTKIYTIKNRTSRSYHFTILENDTILLTSGGTNVCIMNLQGDTVLKEWTEKDKETDKSLKANVFSFIAADGTYYTASRNFGLLRIYHGDKMIYRSSIVCAIVISLAYINIPFYVASVLWSRKRMNAFFNSILSISN